MGGSSISWTICISFALHSRQITTPAPHHSIFYGPGALPVKALKESLQKIYKLQVNHTLICFIKHLRSASMWQVCVACPILTVNQAAPLQIV